MKTAGQPALAPSPCMVWKISGPPLSCANFMGKVKHGCVGMDNQKYPCSFCSMSIITGRGDSGETDLLYGKRIAKGSLRVACLGGVDELNAALGMARVEIEKGECIELIDQIQSKLVTLMGQLAVLPEDEQRHQQKQKNLINEEDVRWVELHAQRPDL